MRELRRGRGGGLAFVLALVLLGTARAEPPAGPFGVAYRAKSMAGGATVHVLRVDLAHADLRVLHAADHGGGHRTAAEFARRSGATAVVNASFFDVDGSPMGLLVVDGAVRQPLRPVDWGVFSVDAERKASIVHTDAWSGEAGVRQAVQSGPRLVIAGEVVGLKNQTAARTAVCVRPDGKVDLVVVERAVSLAGLARFLVDEGCRDAMNLDGGPSTQLFLDRAGVRVDVPGGTPVPIALGVFVEGAADIAPAPKGCGGG